MVDDGSQDSTAETVRSLKYKNIVLMKNRRNLGKGAAVRRGVLHARGDIIMFCDADGATPFSEYRKLQKALTHAQVSIGSRAKKGAVLKKRQPRLRELLGKSFNLTVQLLFLPGIWDTQCGFKMFKREAAQSAFSHMTTSSFAFDVEALYRARKCGYKIVEVPVIWEDKSGSKVSPIPDGMAMLKDLLWLKFRLSWKDL